MSKKKEKKSGNTGKHVIMIAVAVLLSILLLGSAVLGLLAYYDVVSIGFVDDILEAMSLKDPEYQPPAVAAPEEPDKAPEKEEEELPDLSTPYSVEPINADDYYEKNATVHETVPAPQAESVREGKDVVTDFAERGFTQYPVTGCYDMEGNYTQEEEISRYASAKRPMYQSYYISTDGDIWQIYEINGKLFANPLSYNIQHSSGAQLMVSESDTLTTYDGTLNKFYTITPKENQIKITRVDRIDAETLEGLL